MNAILQLLQFVQQHKASVALTIGAVVGLLLGLAIGWWWWPVEWTNSTPGNLRPDFQSDYVLWVAEQYTATGDVGWAYDKLGVQFWKEGQLAEVLEGLAQERGGQEAINLRALAEDLEAALVEVTPTEPEASFWVRLRPVAMVCGAAALTLAVVAGAWILVSRLRRPSVKPEAARREGVAEGFLPSERVSWGAEGPPLAQFVTTYTLGDDHYDPSFSIELESGEFMGECGVGISETIGVGAPNKVTAFEVWLFDKNDIRTVTTVLMSEYAFYDEALRAKLAPKGEPLLAEVGSDLILETKTLRVQARVVEAAYGVGNLPLNSFFERLTVDLAAWVKPGQEGAQPVDQAGAPVMPPTL
ncbi:MAG: hypothetical protein ACE5OS_12485 [Anaerolineae bacterium]